MIKLSRANQTSLFPDYKGTLTKHIIPTLIGDIFETVTRILFKSHIVGAGIGVKADLIANRALIEVKSGYYPCGKVVFTERQWRYYNNYHKKYSNDGIDIIYIFYGYHRDKKRPFYQFKDEDEIIKHVLGGVKKLYLLDHESFDVIRDQVAYHFNWPYKHYVGPGLYETGHTPGFYVTFRELENILSEYESEMYNVPEMDIMGYRLCSFGCHSFNLVGHNCDGIVKLQKILSGMGDGHVKSIPPEYEEKEEPPLPF